MDKVALNKFTFLISILLILFSFSCSNEPNNEELEYKKLEYHGYKFSEGKVSVFFKDYYKEKYLVTLNSLSPEKEIKEALSKIMRLEQLFPDLKEAHRSYL